MTEQRFLMPDVGEGLTEAEIVTWRVASGDTIAVNDVIVEIETAKSIVELPSPFAGTVGALLANEGDTVEVGAPIITVLSEGSAGDAPAAAGANPEAAQLEADAAASISEEDAAGNEGGSGAVLVGYGEDLPVELLDHQGHHEVFGQIFLRQHDKDGAFRIAELLGVDSSVEAKDLLHLRIQKRNEPG